MNMSASRTGVSSKMFFTLALLMLAANAYSKTTQDKAYFANAADLVLAPKIAAREADWRIGPVVYQVLPDRFAPSATLEKKRHLYAAPRILRSWDENPQRGTLNEAVGLWSHEMDFWGGDIASLSSKLGYIESLGVDVLYLNPIHQAYTNHKYDAQDYFKVSPEFGTREEVKLLAADLHKRNMKLVLDGVFNHMGRNSPMFQDALNNPASPWRGWYFIDKKYKLGYRAWWDVANLPDVNWENAAVRARLFGDDDSVVQGWLKDGIDGWRLDVAYDIGFRHLSELTAAAHRAKPGSLVLGEVYNYPTDWVNGPMDGILNITASELIYQMATGQMSARHAGDISERLVQDTDYEGLLRSWITLDNHDKPRLASWLPKAEERRFAQILQFTLPGAPNLYYGVELGMTGPDDPSNRGPMPWELARDDNPEFSFVKRLTQLRRSTRALRVGEFHRLDAENLFAFSRYTERAEDFVAVIANPTDKPVSDFIMTRDSKLVNNEILKDALSGTEVRLAAGSIRVIVPAKTVMVFRPVMLKPNMEYDAYKRVQ
jgi:glycosidase